METTAYLRRFIKTDYYTIARLQVYNNEGKLIFEGKTLELPNRANVRNISCIPTGSYLVKKHFSEKFGECYHLQNVPNRDEILIHFGNFYKDTRGCILLGTGVVFNNDYTKTQLIYSRNAMQKLNSLNLKSFTLKISELC